MEKLREIYSGYIQDVAKVYRDAKPMDGMFGWGDDPRKDPCHMRFYEGVQQWAADFLKKAPEQEEVFAAVRFILETPAKHREQSCFWFLYAAQGAARELIPLLNSAQCACLREFYDKAYPKRDRMPVQQEIYKLLKKGGK